MDKRVTLSNAMNKFRYEAHPFIQRVTVMNRGTRVGVGFYIRYMSFNEPSQLRALGKRLVNEKHTIRLVRI